MTRFRVWDDGSVARLDVDERGLGLALKDPDGQLAAVFVYGWRPMHSGYSGVRAYSRFVLDDGSLGDARADLPNEVSQDDDDTRIDTYPTADGGSVTTIKTGGGAPYGGTTTEIVRDGHGGVTRTTTFGDGTVTKRIEQEQPDGSTDFSEDTKRPDGTETFESGNYDEDGLGHKEKQELDHGQVKSNTVVDDFTHDGSKVHKSVTTLPSHETQQHLEVTQPDGTKFTEDVTTDINGGVSGDDTHYEWPSHDALTHLNPDGTTTITNMTTDRVDGEIRTTTSTEVRDENGRQVGDVKTETDVFHDDGSMTMTEEFEHPDGSTDVVKSEFDEWQQLKQPQEFEHHPPPDPKVDTDPTGGTETDTGTDGTDTTDTGTDGTDTGTDGTDTGTDGTDTGTDGTDTGTDGTTGTSTDGTTGTDTGPGGRAGPDGHRGGGIDLTGRPCDPSSDPGCLAIKKKANRDSPGAIGSDLDTLQGIHGPRGLGRSGKVDGYVATAARLALEIFGDPAEDSGYGGERRGRALVAELETPRTPGDGWDDLTRPDALERSLTRFAEANRARRS